MYIYIDISTCRWSLSNTSTHPFSTRASLLLFACRPTTTHPGVEGGTHRRRATFELR